MPPKTGPPGGSVTNTATQDLQIRKKRKKIMRERESDRDLP